MEKFVSVSVSILWLGHCCHTMVTMLGVRLFVYVSRCVDGLFIVKDCSECGVAMGGGSVPSSRRVGMVNIPLLATSTSSTPSASHRANTTITTATHSAGLICPDINLTFGVKLIM